MIARSARCLRSLRPDQRGPLGLRLGFVSKDQDHVGLTLYNGVGRNRICMGTTARALLDPTTGERQPGGEVKLWDLKTLRKIRTLRNDVGDFQVIAFSREGRRIALAERETGDFTKPVAVFVWDVETGQDLFTLRGHSDRVTALAFSPDDRRLATSSRDRTVKLWDMATGEEVLTLRGHTAGVECVAWSPDGLRLVSGSIDWTARVWDATPLKPEAPQGAEPAPASERP